MSLCDTCPDPGRCCRAIVLYPTTGLHGLDGKSELEVLAWLAESWQPMNGAAVAALGRQHTALPLPFLPDHIDERGHWALRCIMLTADGRCGDYANRPWLCSVFEPGSEGMSDHKICVYPEFTGDPACRECPPIDEQWQRAGYLWHTDAWVRKTEGTS